MSQADLLLALGVFVGGAAPWLEAIVVIPAGILAGLHPVTALLAGCLGNLLTVALAAWFGERIRTWWRARRDRRRELRQQQPGPDPAGRSSRRRQRVERLMRRYGMPALALLGPIGLGTQISALVAVGAGVSARAAFWWVGAGTVLWSTIAAVAAVTGLSVAGVGG